MLARAAIVFARHQLKQLAACTCSNCIRTQNFATPLLAGRQTKDKQHTKLPKHVPATPFMQHVTVTCMHTHTVHMYAGIQYTCTHKNTPPNERAVWEPWGSCVVCNGAMAECLRTAHHLEFINLAVVLCAMTRRCMQCMHVHMCKLQRPSKPSIRHLATSPCIGMYHTCIWLDRFRCAPSLCLV